MRKKFEHAMKKVESDIKQNESFRWHPQAQLRSISCAGHSAQPAMPNALSGTQNGVQYVVDIDCENTLRSLRQVLTNRQEFCVHPPLYKPEPVCDHNKNGSFFQCLSSGTDGLPKRVRRTHRSWINSFHINAQLAGITSADSYAIIGRLSHSLALYAALEAAHLGADLHAITDLRADRQFNALRTLQSSILYATPTQLRRLCKHAKATDIDQLRVRHIFCGGGKLDQATAINVRKVFQLATIQVFYGATETSFISITDDQTPSGSVGKPYPSVEIAIGKTPSTHDRSKEHTIGKIWVRSPYLFQAYVDKHALAAHWHNGYISVGEMGYVDREGYLFLAGRESRRVSIADTVVYPEEIETALLELAAVSHCAVIPVEDDQRGCVLVAVVEAAGSQELKQKLLTYLRRCVGPLKAPRDIVFVNAMPQLLSGKPDLRSLELQLSQQVKQDRPT